MPVRSALPATARGGLHFVSHAGERLACGASHESARARDEDAFHARARRTRIGIIAWTNLCSSKNSAPVIVPVARTPTTNARIALSFTTTATASEPSGTTPRTPRTEARARVVSTFPGSYGVG